MQSSNIKIDKTEVEETVEAKTLPTGKSAPFDVANFRLFVFQPDEKFYHLPFEARLALLVEKIKLAQSFMTTNQAKGLKAIFVAPEYLFKDFSKFDEERYFTHLQKKDFLHALSDLAQASDMILAPGTLCWRKQAKNSDKVHYRNAIYFFHGREIKKHKKSMAADSDFDVAQTLIFKGGTDSPHIDIGGLKIAVEVCLEHSARKLYTSLIIKKQSLNMDIHLIVADGVTDLSLLKKHGLLTIKVERQPNAIHQDAIGTNKQQSTMSYAMQLEPADLVVHLAADLNMFKFKLPQPIAEEKTKIYWTKAERKLIDDEIDKYLNRTSLPRNRRLSLFKNILVQAFQDVINNAYDTEEIRKYTLALKDLNAIIEELNKNNNVAFMNCNIDDEKLKKCFYQLLIHYTPNEALSYGGNQQFNNLISEINQLIQKSSSDKNVTIGKKYLPFMSSGVAKLCDKIEEIRLQGDANKNRQMSATQLSKR